MANLNDSDLFVVGRGAATYKATFKELSDSLPHVADASETTKGVVELATAAETTAGTDSTRAVHPAGLKVELDKKADQATTYTKTETDTALALKADQATTYTKTEVDTAVNAKAPLASPALTGTPTAPTATAGTSTTQLATTEFVTTAVAAGSSADASETVKGIVELATAAETTAGTDNTRAVHPAGLKVELDKKADQATTYTKTETDAALTHCVKKDAATSTGAALIPAGTTAQRPASPVAGMQRFNTQKQASEIYDGNTWRGGSEHKDAGGWQGGNIIGVTQQFVAKEVGCTFNVRPITLTKGSWIVTANVFATLDPNKPSGGYVGFQVVVPYSTKGGSATPNLEFISKPDSVSCRGGGDANGGMAYENCLTFFAQCSGDVTLSKIGGMFFMPNNGTHDLKVNCWYTAARIS